MPENLTNFLSVLDLIGALVFAVSGAKAAKEQHLDLFGILIIAFLTACGGGIIRDVLLGQTPPMGINHWPYLAATVLAVIAVALIHPLLEKMKYPVQFFDALGLSVFSVTGAQKALELGQSYQVAILLGMLTAIGGGVLRDLLLRQIPVVFRKEIYGSAALLGAISVVFGNLLGLSSSLGMIVGFLCCFLVRVFSIRHRWNLPSLNREL